MRRLPEHATRSLGGIHHVTAIGGDPQRTVDFYAGVLGLRFVKRTVNFDDPTTYHLYFGDDLGHPGTILTFFSWPEGAPGRQGTGQATEVSLSVPSDAIPFWRERLAAAGVAASPLTHFDEPGLCFRDPDGLPLGLVAAPGGDPRDGRADGPVPRDASIRGVYGVTLMETPAAQTTALLRDTLGFRLVQQSGTRARYAVGPGGPGAILDVVTARDAPAGRTAVGTIHHVAWRTPDDGEQRVWRQQIDVLGYKVTPIVDRLYFHSIYFREPGGALFEIATDPPGFTVDEPPDRFGETLRLPPWLDELRDRIGGKLPPLRLPGAAERMLREPHRAQES